MVRDMSPTQGSPEGDKKKEEKKRIAEIQAEYERALQRFPMLQSMSPKEAIAFLVKQYNAVEQMHNEVLHDLQVSEQSRKKVKE